MIPPDLSSAPAAGPARPVAPVEAVAVAEGQGFAETLAKAVLAEDAKGEGAEEGEPAAQAAPAAPAPQVAPAFQVAPASPPILAVGLPQAAVAAPAPDEGGEGAPERKAVEAAGAKAAAPAPLTGPVAAPAPAPPAEAGAALGAEAQAPAEGEAGPVSAAPQAAAQAPGGEAPAPRAVLADPSAAAVQAAPAWRLAASHGAEAAHAPRAPARARDVAEQITLAVANAAEPRVELRLDPPELGRVQIRLTHGETGLQAVVLADRPETQDFLRRNAEVLRMELTEAGYGAVSLEFFAGQDAAPRDRGEETRRAVAFGAAQDGPAAAAARPRSAAGSGGLDIRL